MPGALCLKWKDHYINLEISTDFRELRAFLEQYFQLCLLLCSVQNDGFPPPFWIREGGQVFLALHAHFGSHTAPQPLPGLH